MIRSVQLPGQAMAVDAETEKNIHDAKGLTTKILVLLALCVALGYYIELVFPYGATQSMSLFELGIWLIPALVLLLILEGVFIVFSLQLARTGSVSYSRPAAVIGMLILAASVWFDVLATISVSPDLSREGNPYIRLFVSCHIPLWGMYLVGFLAQFGITIIVCALWLSFLRHYRTYLRILWVMGPQNLFQFIWVGTAGNLKTTRTHPSKALFSRSYRAFWIITICLIEPISRLVYGLEWLGFPIRYWLGPYIGMNTWFAEYFIVAVVAAAFMGWLAYCYYSQKEAMLTQGRQAVN